MREGKRVITEKLESRQLLSASLNATTGLLSITSAAAGDKIAVSRANASVIVVDAGGSFTFTASKVKSLKLTLGSGADSVAISSSVSVPTTIVAGAGPDTLGGGGGLTTFSFGAAAASAVLATADVLSPGSAGSALDFTGVPAANAVTANLTSDTNLAAFGNVTLSTMTAGQSLLFTAVTGGAGDDSFTANTAADSLVGGSGNATLVAGSGNDTLVGSGPQTDYVFHDQSAPVVYTLSQVKTGQNHLDFSALSAGDPVTANLNYDLMASYTNVQIRDARAGQYNNFNQITGGQGEDILSANNQGDTILGGNGDEDLIYGGAGADFIELGSGTNIVSGEGGADIIFGGSGYDVVYATDYTSDPLYTLPGNAASKGTVPGMQFYAGSGDASMVGGPGNDTLIGGSGNCTMHGMGGNDELFGGSGNSVLFGDSGNDTLIGGQGNNILAGGSGQDMIEGGTVGGTQTFIDKNLPDNFADASDGASIDTAGITAAAIATDLGTAPALYPELGTAGPGDIVLGGSANTTIIGGLGGDTLRGGDGPCTEVAGDGNDLLIAGNGLDVLQGGGGDDTLAAGGGADAMTGGIGNDTFLNLNGYADTITGGSGFNVAQDDPTGLSVFSGIQVIYTPNNNEDPPSISRPAVKATVPHGATPGAVPTLATVAGSVLKVGSSAYAGAQNISVSQAGGVITVTQANVGTQTFSSAGLTLVSIVGGAGDDNINLFSLVTPATVNTGNGNNYVVGGPGNETITGGSGNDTLIGAGGRNVISGGAGNNVLYGGTGDDVINGGPGSDWIYPGGYAISLGSDAESDTINGGTGTEKVDLAGDADPMTIRMDKGLITDNVTGAVTRISRVRNLWAGSGNDMIIGATAGGVLLNAGSGNDTVFGISASDIIYGGVGNDVTFLDGNQGFLDLYGNHASTPGNIDYFNQGTTIIPPSVDPSDIKTGLQHQPT